MVLISVCSFSGLPAIYKAGLSVAQASDMDSDCYVRTYLHSRTGVSDLQESTHPCLLISNRTLTWRESGNKTTFLSVSILGYAN